MSSVPVFSFHFVFMNVHIAYSVVSPRMGSNGWPFANVDSFPAAGVDPVNHAQHIKDLYLKVEPNYDGR